MKVSRFIVSSLSAALLALLVVAWLAPLAQARGVNDRYIGIGSAVWRVQTDLPTAQVSTSTTDAVKDSDNDGVDDDADLCQSSTPGYPVRADGCSLLDGVLSGIRFKPASSELEAGSEVQLDFLIDILVNRFPDARIELHSHTDNEGDVRSQAILTRGRLRTVGTYLVNRGVRANQLVLRSFGGSRPLYDNVSQVGRDANNRIEVIERPR